MNALLGDLRVEYRSIGTLVAFARNARIHSAGQVDQLKKAVEKTGVFELKGTCYLVPDAPVDCLLLDFGEKQQMLYWDEVETPGYGISIAPKPRHKKFMNYWKEVNKLALDAISGDSRPFAERFQLPPNSWRLKKPIQSE